MQRHGKTFFCPLCTDVVYNSSQSMQSHFRRKHKSATSASVNTESLMSNPLVTLATPPFPSSGGQERLTESPVLRQIDCTFNTAHRLLICKECQHAVDPGSLISHIQNHGHRLTSRELGTILTELRPVSQKTFQSRQPIHHDAVKGIKVNPRGYMCSYEGCQTSRSSKDSIHSHCTKAHPGAHASPLATRGHIQAVFGPNTRCTRVTPIICEEEVGERAAAYLRNYPRRILQPIDPDSAAETSPFMRATKWHKYYKSLADRPNPVTRQTYRKLSHPDKLSDREKLMRNVVRNYTVSLIPLIEGAVELPLKWINSKEYVFTF